MKNKTTVLSLWVGIMTTIGIFVHLFEIIFKDISFTWHFGLWLIGIAYTVFLYSADDVGTVWKQHVKLFNAAISVFKKKI